MAGELKTDEQIVAETNELARRLYSLMGYEAPEGFQFQLSEHPQELLMWEMACAAQEILTGTDPESARSD